MFATSILAPGLASQDAAEWRARLAGETVVASRALAEAPPGLASTLAPDVVELLRRGDAALRNEAVAWLMNRPELADALLPRLTELRRAGDVDTARAAGVVYRTMADHRSVSLDELRGQLQDPSRLRVALDALAKAPQTAFVLLPELLRLQAVSNADALLTQLIAQDRARVEAAVAAAIDGGGDADALVGYLERASGDLRRHAERLDAWRPTQGSHRTGAAIAALTRLVVAGMPPPPHWLLVLRRDDEVRSRRALLDELGKHAVPANLWPELLPLLRDPQTSHQIAAMLLAEGRGAASHRDAVRAALVAATSQTVGNLADLAAQLAPATRDCAPLLLPHLTIDHAPTVQGLLFALGELGDDAPEVVAAVEVCTRHADADVRRVAAVVLRQLGAAPADAGSVDSEQLLADVAVADWDRAFDAELRLAAKGVSPHTVLERMRARPAPRGDWLQFRAHRGLMSDVLRRMAAEPCRDATQVAGLATVPWLPVQDEVRRLDVLAASGAAGREQLVAWLFARPGQRHVLEAIAAIGAPAAGLCDGVAPFVHHDEAEVREAASACLRTIGGEGALQRALASPDPWPRLREVEQAKDLRTVIAFVTDAAVPAPLRARALSGLLGRLQILPAKECEPLLAMLQSPDAALRRLGVEVCQNHSELLHPGGRNGAIDPRVLRAFAGGPRDVREPLAFLIRTTLGVVIPAPRVVRLGLAGVEGAVDAQTLTRLALVEMRARNRSPGLLQALLATHHPLASVCLRSCGQQVPVEVVPLLVEALARPDAPVELLVGALLPFPEGRQAVLDNAARLPANRRLSLLAAAGADLFALRADIAAALEALRSHTSRDVDFDVVARLPWRDRGEELREIADLVTDLWTREPSQRASMLPVLTAMGSASDFATDDLIAMLPAGGAAGEGAAIALLANGNPGAVTAWLRRYLEATSRPALARAELRVLWTDLVAERIAEAKDEEIDALLASILDLQNVSVQARTAIDVRLLARAEARGLDAGTRLGWIDGELDPAAKPLFEAFLQRRRESAPAPDPLAAWVTGRVFSSFPALVLTALRDGVVDGAAVFQPGLLPTSPERIAPVALELIAAGARQRDPGLGPRIGTALARLPSPPVDKVIAYLTDAASRPYALQVLAELGPKALPAIDAVEALAAGDDDTDRFVAARVLACMGPVGITRLGVLLPQKPELVGVLDHVLASGDAPAVSSVASVFLMMPRKPDEFRAKALRVAAARMTDAKTRAMLVLALLHFDAIGTDHDWLGLASLEPAVVRRRAITAMRAGQLTPLQLGVLVEFLDDPDPGVRAAAVDMLLADVANVATCRLGLEEYAHREGLQSAPAAAVREALHRLPDASRR